MKPGLRVLSPSGVSPEEVAAILAALEVLREEPEPTVPRRSRWMLAGLSAAPWDGERSSWSRWDRGGF